MRAGPGQDGGRVGETAGERDAGERLSEDRDLVLGIGMLRLVGPREMTHRDQIADMGTGGQRRMGAGEILRRQSDPMHARVQLDPAIQPARRARRQHPLQLLAAMDRHGQPEAIHERDLLRRENPFQ